jgi:DNA-damage-inducible protein J
MSYIQLRIDDETKNSAKKILDKLGVDMTSAIKLYLKQIVINKGIPFKLVTENGFTLEQEREILKASEEAKQGKNVTGPFSTMEEIQDYLDSLK